MKARLKRESRTTLRTPTFTQLQFGHFSKLEFVSADQRGAAVDPTVSSAEGRQRERC